MIQIEIQQEVVSAPQYVTSVSGDFELLDFVPCRRKIEQAESTCAFLAATVVSGDLYNN
jgi:hypothetical protein